jgi:hypothetical protein
VTASAGQQRQRPGQRQPRPLGDLRGRLVQQTCPRRLPLAGARCRARQRHQLRPVNIAIRRAGVSVASRRTASAVTVALDRAAIFGAVIGGRLGLAVASVRRRRASG